MQSITPYQQSGSNRSRSRYTFRHERESDLTRLGRLSQFRHCPLYCLSSDCAWVDSVQLTLSPRRLCFWSRSRLYISRSLLLFIWVGRTWLLWFAWAHVTRPRVLLLWSRACSFRYRHAVLVTWLPFSQGRAAFQCRSHAVGSSESSASRGWSADLSPTLSVSGACLVIGRADDS